MCVCIYIYIYIYIYIQCAYQLKTNNCVTLTLGHVKCPELMLSQLGIITCCLSHEHAFKYSRRQAERQKRSGASEKPQWRMTVLAVQSDKTLPLSNYKGCSGVMLHWFCVLYTSHGESSLSTHTQVHFSDMMTTVWMSPRNVNLYRLQMKPRISLKVFFFFFFF